MAVLQRARAWEQIGCDAFHELEARFVQAGPFRPALNKSNLLKHVLFLLCVGRI